METIETIFITYPKESKTIAFAARELQKHLLLSNPAFKFVHNENAQQAASADRLDARKSTDSGLHIALKLMATPINDDAFSILITDQDGTITGSNERSVLLGVYRYLRDLGFVFLSPTKTKIPQLQSLKELCATCDKKASLRHRGVCIEGADSLEHLLDFIDWLPKLGFNSFFTQFRRPFIFFDRYYENHREELDAHASKLLSDLPAFFESETDSLSSSLIKQYGEKKAHLYELFYQKMLLEIKKRGLLLHSVGHGWTCTALDLPSVGWVKETKAPPEEIRKRLAVVNGQRAYIDGIPLNTNLCYENPAAIDSFVDAVTAYASSNPQADYIHVWLADEPNHICECDACQATFFTDQYVRLLNEIDARMTKKQISGKMVFLLYQELLYPPVQERLHHPDRFVLMFAPISRTFKTSYPKEIKQMVLKKFKRNQMQLPVSIDENLSYLYEWQQVFKGDSLDYDYPLGRAHYGDFGYTQIARTIFNDIESLPFLSLNGYISCQELRAASPNALPNYVMGYKLFDADEDFESLCGEYFAAAYADAAPMVRDYLTHLSALSDCDYFNGIGPRHDAKIADTLKKAVEEIVRFRPFIEEATDGEDTDFFSVLLFHSHYEELLVSALAALAAGDDDTARDQYLQFKKYIQENEKRFEPYLDVWRILEVSGKYAGFQNLFEDAKAPTK